jgi:hypothetical protein
MLGVAGERPRLRELASGAVSWQAVLDAARAHAVAETVHHALAAHGLDGQVPEEIRAALREAHDGATARNALLLAESARVQAALAAGGVSSALLKGTALVAAHYPSLGARHVGDVDLLVPAEALDRAIRAVVALGARPLQAHATLDARSLPAWKHHAPAMVLPSGVLVELHRRYGLDRATGAATDDILARSHEVTWSGRTLRIAARDDLLGLACEHVHVEHRWDRRFRPRHAADCAVLLAAGADPRAGAQLPGAAEAVRSSLAILSGDSRRLLVSRASAAMDRAWGLWRAAALGGAAHMFFPDRDFVSARYGVRRSSRLLPLLYLWRPLRSAWRVMTGR